MHGIIVHDARKEIRKQPSHGGVLVFNVSEGKSIYRAKDFVRINQLDNSRNGRSSDRNRYATV